MSTHKESLPGKRSKSAGTGEAHRIRSGPSIPHVPDIASMNRRGQYIAMEYYRVGYEHGWLAGYDAARAEQDALDRRAAALGSMLAKGTPYADLADRRGQHDRAEAQRRTLRERGIQR